MKSRHAVLAVAFVVVAATGWWLINSAEPPAAEPAKVEPRLAPLRLRFPEGLRALYRTSWRSTAGGGITPRGADGTPLWLAVESDLSGLVAVEGLGLQGGDWLVALSFAQVERFDFKVQGQVTSGEAVKDALVGARAWLTVSPRGEVRAISFDHGVAPSVASALRTLALQLHLALPDEQARPWVATELVSVGQVRFEYQREGTRLFRHAVAFERLDAVAEALAGASRLDGAATLTLSEQGELLGVEDQGDWSYTRAGGLAPAMASAFTFSFERVETALFDAVALRAALPAEGASLDTPVADPERAARRDARLAEPVSLERLARSLRTFEAGQGLENDFLVRVGAFLRLHPEHASALVEQFQSSTITVRGRGLVLDMLVQAGDANAQAAMREALATSAARAKPGDYGMLVQRFTFLRMPQPESQQYLQQALEQARGGEVTDLQGAATALGAVARRLEKTARPHLAREANQRLLRALEGETDPARQRGVLAGLGNAGRPENVETIRKFSTAADPQVRAQAAASLRSVDSRDAREALLAMGSDEDPTVASSAFSSLQHQTLSANDWRELSRLVEAGRVVASAEPALVQLLKEQRTNAGPEGDLMLKALLAKQESSDSDLGEVIRQALSAR